MSLSINEIVNVQAVIESSGLQRRDFGIGLFLTTDTQLGTGSNRFVILNSLDDASGYTTTSQPYLAAQRWFSQIPTPQSLVLGRWINANAPAILAGGMLSATVSQFAAISNGSFSVTVNGVVKNISSLNFSSVASYADIVTVIQTALTSASVACTLSYQAATKSFKLVSNSSGAAQTLTYFSATGSGTDISTLTAMTQTLASSLNQGADAETVVAALDTLKALYAAWYLINLDQTLDDTQTVLDVSAWVNAQTDAYMFSAGSSDVSCLTSNENSSIFAQLFAVTPARTWGTWSANVDEKPVSASARYSSVNFDQPNSVITLMFKQLQGCVADTQLTSTNIAELKRKRVNYYVPFSAAGTLGTDAIYANGTTFNPDAYIDARICLDWWVNAVQIGVYNLLRQTPKDPQTDAGNALIVQVIDTVCQQAIRNGMIAPGQVSTAMQSDIIDTTGNASFDGYLGKGYLIWSQSSALQSQSDRNARKATSKKVWLKSAGAIHEVDISVTFEN